MSVAINDDDASPIGDGEEEPKSILVTGGDGGPGGDGNGDGGDGDGGDGDGGEDPSTPPSAVIPEGTSTTYDIELQAAPTGPVTVSVTSLDPRAATVAPSTLYYTTDNWDQPQTVTVTALDDADGRDESITIVYAASGGGYDRVSARWRVVIIDDDLGITLSPSSLTLVEGGAQGTYTVALAVEPNGEVVVSLTSDDPEAAAVSPATVTLNASNWRAGRTVTVTPVDDDDGRDESVTIRHQPTGGRYGPEQEAVLAVTVTDDDRGLALSAATVRVGEGSSSTYTVRLAAPPTGDVSVTLTTSGDEDLVIDTDATASDTRNVLTFNAETWATPQTVTVTAAQDDDGANGEAIITHEAAGAGHAGVTRHVTAIEIDDDPLGLLFNPAALTVRSGASASYAVTLKTRPLGAVSILISSSDAALSVSPATLEFAPDVYDTPQKVTVALTGSGDAGEDRSGTISHAASGGDYGDVTGSMTVELLLDQHPTFAEGARIPDQRYTQYREIDPLILPEASGGDGALRYALTPAPPAGLVFNAETRTLSGTPSAAAPATAYRYEVADSDASDPDRASLTFRITVDAAPRDDGLKDALAAQGRALLTSATSVLDARFRQGAAPAATCTEEGDGEAGRRREGCARQALDYVAHALAAGARSSGVHAYGMSGTPTAWDSGFETNGDQYGMAATHPHRIHDPVPGYASPSAPPMDSYGHPTGVAPLDPSADRRWDTLLWGRSFVRGLGGGKDGQARWTVWGAGDLQTFNGTSATGSQDGELRTLYLGTDRSLGETWLAGAAVSRSWGEIDYAAGGRGRRTPGEPPECRVSLRTRNVRERPGALGDGGLRHRRCRGPTHAGAGGGGGPDPRHGGVRSAPGPVPLARTEFCGRRRGRLSLPFHRRRRRPRRRALHRRASSKAGRGARVGQTRALALRTVRRPLRRRRRPFGNGRRNRGRRAPHRSASRRGRQAALAHGRRGRRPRGIRRHGPRRPQVPARRHGLDLRDVADLGQRGGRRLARRGASGKRWLVRRRPTRAVPRAAGCSLLSMQSELGYGFESPRLRGLLTALLSHGSMGSGQSRTEIGFSYRSLPNWLSRDLTIEFRIGLDRQKGLGVDRQALLSVTMLPWDAGPHVWAPPAVKDVEHSEAREEARP